MVQIILPKKGSKWSGQSGHLVFRVLETIEMEDGHTWVHYREEDRGDKQYSCYVESFLQRFRELPE